MINSSSFILPDIILDIIPPGGFFDNAKSRNTDYPLKDGQTPFYICRDHSCLPPTNDLRMYDLL